MSGGGYDEEFKLERTDYVAEARRIRTVFLTATRLLQTEFERLVEEASASMNPEMYDLGDVMHAAETEMGLDYSDGLAHEALTSIVRAVSLTEHTFARVAARFLNDTSHVIHYKGHSWTRTEAELFFGSCLKTKVRLYDQPMAVFTDIRDRYVHGYGTFWEPAAAADLVGRLWDVLDHGEVTTEELSLGLEDPSEFIAGCPRAVRPMASEPPPWPGTSSRTPLRLTIRLSRLATVRILDAIEAKVMQVFSAASDGLKPQPELDGSKFVKQWAKNYQEMVCRECGAVVRPARRDVGELLQRAE